MASERIAGMDECESKMGGYVAPAGGKRRRGVEDQWIKESM